MSIRGLLSVMGVFLLFLAAELPAAAQELPPRYAKADTDSDGKLTQDEYVGHAKKRAEKRATKSFHKMDIDGDGKISEQELVAFAQRGAEKRALRRFQRMDANADGLVTSEEIEQARRKK